MPIPAHIGAFLEPLLFLPAFLIVFWSVAGSIRRRNTLDSNGDR